MLVTAIAISAEVRRWKRRRIHGAATPAQDLGAGHDRGHEAGDLVRLGVAVQLQQVGLQRVERVEARPRR